MNWNVILEFLQKYGHLLISGISLLIGLIVLIVCLVKGKVKPIEILGKVYPMLTQYIIEAEEEYEDGSSKWTYVMCKALSYVSKITGYSLDKCCEKFRVALDSAIEDILSAPQKKGE